VRPYGSARGVAGMGVVYHTLSEPEDYLLHVILSGAYLCDVARMMLCVIISGIFTSWSVSQWYRMPIAFDRFCLMVSLKILKAVELYVRRGVGGCLWPSSVSVTLSGAQLWALRKHAPTSDYAAEVTTFLITAATLSMDPLSVSYSGDLFPRKNRPPRRLRALETER
jgi:hypothetical protein